MTPPPAAPPSADTVLLIADPRLDALRGQTLLVADCQVVIPETAGAFLVPMRAARVLLMQVGWRLAPGQALPVTLESPAAAPVIRNPQQTREGINRVQVAQVASPSAAEMHARESRGLADPADEYSLAPALLAIAAVAEASVAEADAGTAAEHAASPAPSAAEAAVFHPLPQTDAAASELHASPPPDVSHTDFGGSSDPLD